MSHAASSQSDATDIELGSLIALLWRRRWIIAACTVCAAGLLGIAALIMTPIYRATTVVVPAELDRSNMGALNSVLSQFGGLAAIAGINVGSSGAATEESLAVLRSREFTEAFIVDGQLMPELYSGLSTWIEDDTPTPAEAFRFFDRQVRSVVRNARTGLVSVSIEWKDPELAAQWANELVARVNAEMRSRAIANSNASVGYLEKELAATSTVDTRAAISRLMEAQINQRMLANVTREYAFRVVDRALPPDLDDVIRPRKLLMIVLGAAAGFLIGIVVGLVLRGRV